jgi:hypothetical protein
MHDYKTCKAAPELPWTCPNCCKVLYSKSRYYGHIRGVSECDKHKEVPAQLGGNGSQKLAGSKYLERSKHYGAVPWSAAVPTTCESRCMLQVRLQQQDTWTTASQWAASRWAWRRRQWTWIR